MPMVVVLEAQVVKMPSSGRMLIALFTIHPMNKFLLSLSAFLLIGCTTTNDVEIDRQQTWGNLVSYDEPITLSANEICLPAESFGSESKGCLNVRELMRHIKSLKHEATGCDNDQ